MPERKTRERDQLARIAAALESIARNLDALTVMAHEAAIRPETGVDALRNLAHACSLMEYESTSSAADKVRT